MTRASLVARSAAVVCALGLAAPAPAFAQAGTTITINGVTCGSWTLGGTAPNIVLTCNSGAATPPVCTVTGSATATVGVFDTLTANCSPAATSFAWAGGSCAGVTTSTCRANEASTGSQNYTVTGTNASGTGAASPAFAVNWMAPTAGAPTGCQIVSTTPSAATPLSSGGGSISMTASCNGTVQYWIWWKNGVEWLPIGFRRGAISPVTQTDTLPANPSAAAVNYTYSAVACNGAACSAQISTTFSVAAAAGGGGGGPGTWPNISCSGFTNTKTYDLPWGYGTNVDQAMGPNDALVVRIQVPANALPTPAGSAGHVDVYEYFGAIAAKWATISQSPCTWTAFDGKWTKFENEPTMWFSITSDLGFPVLQPGQTYYVNVQHTNPFFGGGTCSSSVCDPSVVMTRPGGS